MVLTPKSLALAENCQEKASFLHILTKPVEPIFQSAGPILRHRASEGTLCVMYFFFFYFINRKTAMHNLFNKTDKNTDKNNTIDKGQTIFVFISKISQKQPHSQNAMRLGNWKHTFFSFWPIGSLNVGVHFFFLVH